MIRRINLSGVLTAIIAVASFVCFLYMPGGGDDFLFLSVVSGPDAVINGLLDYPRWAAVHWLTCNGRMGDRLLTPMLAAPRWLMALACAMAVALMYWASVRCVRGAGRFWHVVLIGVMSFALPWWDSMNLFCCQFNYIWPSAFVLSAFLLVMRGRAMSGLPLVLSVLFCALAGNMHEAASGPLVAGVAVMIVTRRLRPDRTQWILLAAFAFGALLCIGAPSIWMRFNESGTPDDPCFPLLLKSDVIAAFLWVLIAVFMTFAAGRRAVVRLFSSPFGALAVASLFSMAISLVSGIVGRSGWFAELYAMIVLTGWASMYMKPRLRAVQFIIAGLVAAQIIGVAVWQVRLGREYRDFENRYRSSADGIVFGDYTKDNEIPLWTLGRLRGVPDADDMYLLHCLAECKHPFGSWPVIVPAEVSELLPLAADTVETSGGDILLKTLPAGGRQLHGFADDPDVSVVDYDGREMVVQPVRGAYFLSPRIHDPGDRF